ncbi:MAG: hypothetical protein FD163_1598 [Hyphomonadaceae bacterium]|nr:MAG: hypothetical protein FD128_118 [Hyphomonadaceae bacterium]KAF0184901.1 MAG: hypothetical protein FD163_1598 [Hyphomonadaceae bacterium]
MNSPPLNCGIGLRAPHVTELLTTLPRLAFVEVHSENYFGGGLARKQLLEVRQNYQVSLHGVGLSLGRFDALDEKHINSLKKLIDDIDPLYVSDHLSFSNFGNAHVPDLLPVPLTNEAMAAMVRNVSKAQEITKRRFLIENPSNYVRYKLADYSEPQFLNELCQKTDCGILLDVNNIAVSAHNLGNNPREYIDAVDAKFVGEIHLAGYQINQLADGSDIIIDTHGNKVFDDVWALYEYTIAKLGKVPTLIEWDCDIPTLDILIAEAARADAIANAATNEALAYA